MEVTSNAIQTVNSDADVIFTDTTVGCRCGASRAPHGARGLKCRTVKIIVIVWCGWCDADRTILNKW